MRLVNILRHNSSSITMLAMSNFIFKKCREPIMIESAIKISDIRRRTFVVPTYGISTKPARNVPVILPIVEIAYRLPTVTPLVATL